jgi:hypothetical protein
MTTGQEDISKRVHFSGRKDAGLGPLSIIFRRTSISRNGAHRFLMNGKTLFTIATLLYATSIQTAAARPERWGLGAHIGGGEMLGFHGKKDWGPMQFRLHFGVSVTYPGGSGSLIGADTLNTRSLDQIAGFAVRGYLFNMLYASAGLSMNDRRIETNIEKMHEDTDWDISTHQFVWEAPLLGGVEFRRGKFFSFYLEAGYVFQLDRAGETVVLEKAGYTAIYKHPSGSPTVGVGATFNFPS